MALENVMRVDNGNVVTGGGGGGNSVEIDWEDWCKLTPEEQETGDWTIINCPWSNGDVSVDLLTKLWENPDPSASFAEQDITGLTTLSDYDLFYITTNSTSTFGSHKFGSDTIFAENVYPSSAASAGTVSHFRSFTIDKANNRIIVSDAVKGYTNTAATVDNSNLIPYQIYGIKLTASVKINAIAMDVSTSADKCMLSENESVKDRIEANNVGNYVDISSYNSSSNYYTCPSDGYVRIIADTSVGTKTALYVVGMSVSLMFVKVAVTNTAISNTIFVRKGSKIYVTRDETTYSGGFFFPLQ